MAAPDSPCQGYLFKLKENNKEWKKIYVVLRGTDIVYYDNPHQARGPPSKKDDTKQVLTATPYDEFDGVRPPTGTPSYMMIETSHAKKIYCAKTVDDRQMWLTNIKKNAEMAARQALQRQASKSAMGTSGVLSGTGTPRKESTMDRMKGFFSSRGKDDSRSSMRESSRARCSSSSAMTAASPRLMGRESRAASEAVAAAPAPPEIPDEQLDEALRQMVAALGLGAEQAEKVYKLKKEAKRDMLKGYSFKQSQDSSKQVSDPKHYVTVLMDDPSLEELSGADAWLRAAPLPQVAEFVAADGQAALASLLADLCRLSERSENDHRRIEQAMKCLKALVKADVGVQAVIASPALVCQSFASGGGSLLLSDDAEVVKAAVHVLSAVALYKDTG